MERRKFLKASALLTAPILFNKIPVLASSALDSSGLQSLATAAANCGKILVIIQMNGGNDGLNTVFPRDQWSKLAAARSNILMNENSVLKLNRNESTGLHPSMLAMQNLYNKGQLMIVQGVSYPNPSFSHFRSTDIWFTASESDKSLQTGWLGRALDKKYQGYPVGYPSSDMPDPLAIQIGSTLPFLLQGPTINMAYSVPKPEDLLNVINETTDPTTNSDYGKELTFLRLMKDQSNVYRSTIQNAYKIPKPQSATYPTSNGLADQLQIVAKLINGGLQTPIYIVNHPRGFDSHEDQVLTTDKTKGRQATNLAILSEAVGAFQADLKIIGKADLVTGMTFSEFGRRIKSNDSLGTDHGAGAPVICFGAALNTGSSNVSGTKHPISGMIGTSPVLPENATVNDQVPMQFDFKQIYSTIMQDWLCMTETQAAEVLGGTFEKIPIFKTKNTGLASNYNYDFMVVYPNPVQNNLINIRFKDFLKGNIKITIFSIQGYTMFEDNFKLDQDDTLSFTINNFISSGNYILELIFNESKFHTKLIFQ